MSTELRGLWPIDLRAGMEMLSNSERMTEKPGLAHCAGDTCVLFSPHCLPHPHRWEVALKDGADRDAGECDCSPPKRVIHCL